MITIFVADDGTPLALHNSAGAIFRATAPDGAARSLRFDPATNSVLYAITQIPEELAELRILDDRITYRGADLPLKEEHPLTRAAWERDDLLARMWTDGAVIKGRELILILRMIAERVGLNPPSLPGKLLDDGQ